MPRIVIVEDHDVMRERLAAIIARYPELELVASVGTLAEGRAALAMERRVRRR